MVSVATIVVSFTGDHIATRWRIEPDAHSLGLVGDVGRGSYRLSDDMGTPDGAATISRAVQSAARGVGDSVARQWSTPHLW